MLAKKIFKWLALVMMLSALAACGGGSTGSEPSSLLSNNIQDTNTDTVDTEPTDIVFFINTAHVIPTAGSAVVTVTVFEANPDAEAIDDNGNTYTDITKLVTENNVPLRVSVTGDAYFLENGKNYLDIETDQRGQAAFTVAHTGNGNELLTVQGRANYNGGGTDSLYFGGSVVAEVINNDTEIPADGSSSAQISVTARDAFLAPISGLNVDFNFSPDSQAVASSDTGFITNANGQVIAKITNSVEQAISVIPYAGDSKANTIKLNFTKAAQSSTVVSATLVNDGIIPADGETPARVIVLARSTEGIALSGLPVSFAFPSDSFAVASPSSGSTDDNGQFITEITNYVTQSTSVTPIVADIEADPITLNFGTSSDGTDSDAVITATLLTQGTIPANGTTTAKLLVLARDLDGIPVEGLPVALAFPKDSFAVATQSIGTTDANGQFLSEISDSIPETVSITAIAGGVSSNAVEIEFIASGGGESPTELDIRVSDSNAVANGSDRVQLVVVARDELGNVVPNVPVKLSGGSATSVMRDTGSNNVGTLYVSGNTGEQGFNVTISNSRAEELTLTAAAVVNDIELTSQPQAVIFTEVPLATEEDATGSVTLEALATEQVADGSSTITLSGQALTQNGEPVANTTVNFEYRGEANITVDNSGRTYADGRFFATMTNENVESFSIRAVVDGVSSPPVVLSFTGQTGDNGEIVTPGLPPSRVNIIATPKTQVADGQSAVSLTVMVWDNSNTPMEGVQVSLSTIAGLSNDVSNTTLFDKAKETTGASGTATFNVTNTRVGQVTVRATAQGIDSSGNASGATESATVSLTFINPIQATQLTLDSTPNTALADGQSPITVTVTAKDSNNATVSDVPISIILADSTARATPSNGTTDADGRFITQVTSRTVEELQLTAQVRDINLSANTSLQFTSASNSSEDVTKLVISQFSDNEQLANGQDAVTIQVSAFDNEGQPVINVPIELITSADFPVTFTQLTGVTGETGVFSTEVSSIEAGIVSITAQAPGTTNNIRSETIGVTFNNSNQDAVPATIELTIENNNQPADDTAQVILVAKVLDEKGQPVVGASVELISNNPALDPADGATNGLGEWRTTLSSALATSITVTAVTTGGSSTKQSSPQTVSFIEVAPTNPPASLTLNISATTASVNEPITLIASAKDSLGTPMSDVSIAFQIVSGSGIFQGAASGTTDGSGTFSAPISSTDAGIVRVRATAAGGAITSNEVSLTFEKASDTQTPVASLILFSNSQSLDSEGSADGVIITARTKDEQNNLLVGKTVNFSVDSGDIQPVSKITNNDGVSYVSGTSNGVTDDTGQAYARLTTVGNSNNRTITVNANSETTVADPLPISVTGTQITISGRDSVVISSNATQNVIDLTITLQDSAKQGIANKNLVVSSQQGHFLSANQIVTNSNGEAVVTLTLDTTKIGDDIITVEKVKETATENTVSATHKLTISDENFTLTYGGTVSSSGVIEIPIGSSSSSGNTGSGGSGLPCVNTDDPNCNDGTTDNGDTGTSVFTVTWLQGATPKVGEHVTISTTRGSIGNIIPSDGNLDETGKLTFTVSSNNVGQAIVTAIADGGPSASLNIEFVAVDADQIALQSSRPVLNPNTATNNNAERSEIIATVWDANNNLVKNKLIDFNLNDVSGGRLTTSRATTDSNGQASTTYIAGFNSSAANGIVITASVVGDDVTPATTRLTVAQRDLFINIGSGNTLLDEDGIRYETLHTVLVTDANGTPVNNAEVTLSIYPTSFYAYNEFDAEGQPIFIQCKNEDINRNGILDAGEDVNGNGRLDPGNVLTFNTRTENTLTLETGVAPDDGSVPNGYADFRVIYAISYANYVTAEITAQATVSGTEESSILYEFTAVCSQADADEGTCPIQNPFRNIGSCALVQ